MSVTVVVAMGANCVIGADGGLPWHLPEDLAHFKKLTYGHPMVMGRATFESIGRALPGRTTIVVTRDASWSHDGVEVAPDIVSAIARARELDDEVFIVGGAQVYAAALGAGLVDRLVLTRVAASPEGDTFFPVLDWDRWTLTGSTPGEGEVDGRRAAYAIETYELT